MYNRFNFTSTVCVGNNETFKTIISEIEYILCVCVFFL